MKKNAEDTSSEEKDKASPDFKFKSTKKRLNLKVASKNTNAIHDPFEIEPD